MTISAHGTLGRIYLGMENPGDAAVEFTKAVELSVKLFGAQHPLTSGMDTGLSVALSKSGETEKALKSLDRALATNKALYGERHVETANILAVYGAVYDEAENFEKAIEYNKQVLDILTECYGSEHPRVAEALFGLGMSIYRKGDRESGIQQMIQGQGLLEKLLGDGDPGLGPGYFSIGMAYLEDERAGEAMPYLKKSISGMETLFSTQKDMLLLLYSAMAFACNKTGDAAGEEKYADKARRVQGEE
jgi:tetratricopeptide (TPR) repeat protein